MYVPQVALGVPASHCGEENLKGLSRSWDQRLLYPSGVKSHYYIYRYIYETNMYVPQVALGAPASHCGEENLKGLSRSCDQRLLYTSGVKSHYYIYRYIYENNMYVPQVALGAPASHCGEENLKGLSDCRGPGGQGLVRRSWDQRLLYPSGVKSHYYIYRYIYENNMYVPQVALGAPASHCGEENLKGLSRSWDQRLLYPSGVKSHYYIYRYIYENNMYVPRVALGAPAFHCGEENLKGLSWTWRPRTSQAPGATPLPG
ncbi:hypothetical protein J6590_064758 [Homalodisca vitripennis]|nr:hypothetical protein J6590_064758 [Homalodisca vitripennis]